MRRTWLPLWVAIALASAGLAGAEEPARPEFEDWLAALRDEALARNVSPATLDSAFAGFAPIERVIELDRNQPESTMTFAAYLDRVASEARVRDGRERVRRHRAVLDRIHARYGVPPRYLVALWGVESDFGRRTGGYPVVHALATLAWDGRRAAFFRGELLDALEILEQGHVEPASMLGSWAGAMGQPQFMPSSFRAYAVDFDGDGRRDIWTSTADVLASAANYLATSGWRGDLKWGREVRLPDGFDVSAAGRDNRRALSEWQALGVRRADGGDLPGVDVRAAIVLPGGAEGPAFATYDNYRVLLKWNRSDYFATAVGILADRIGDGR